MLPLRFFTKSYERLLLVMLCLMPLLGIAYLKRFQEAFHRFEHHMLHEIAILGIIILSGFVATITWRCYRISGETFLYWLSLGFMGFTLVYLPHGLFTRFAHDNIWFFLLYGPASRIVMGTLLFWGLLTYGLPAEPREERKGWKSLLVWMGAFLVIDLAIGLLAWSPIAGHVGVRLTMELGALALAVTGIVILLVRRFGSPLMTVYLFSLAFFAQSSLSFIYGRPWDHQWWLAHLIFAAGFFVLSFGVVRAFHTTRAFSLVYSQEELMEKLQQAKDRAEDANRVKSAFLANVSHELRTPLNGMLGMLQLLQSSELTAEQEEYVSLANEAGQGLIVLTSDLLDLARVESGKLEITPGVVNLQEFFDNLKKFFHPMVSEKRLTLDVEVEPSLPAVQVDEGRLRQILINLLGNSIKFTHEGGIQCGVRAAGERLEFFIADTGVGIPSEQLERIFEPFAQVEGNFQKSFRGAGLGLAIVQRLVDLMEGEMVVDSQLGLGTKMTVFLPFSVAES